VPGTGINRVIRLVYWSCVSAIADLASSFLERAIIYPRQLGTGMFALIDCQLLACEVLHYHWTGWRVGPTIWPLSS
jgi:hypothetical protein